MKKLSLIAIGALLITGCSGGDAEKDKKADIPDGKPKVNIETDMGLIVLELFPDVAPNHVQNFLDLVEQGFYNGLTFHRVRPGFIIQGGDPKGDGSGHAGYLIPAEFSNLKHMPGTLSMARGNDPNSASCQFFICLGQLPDLDNKYTIFGQVVEGMNVANEIAKVEVKGNPKLREKSMPVEPVHMIQLWRAGTERPPLEADSTAVEGVSDSN